MSPIIIRKQSKLSRLSRHLLQMQTFQNLSHRGSESQCHAEILEHVLNVKSRV